MFGDFVRNRFRNIVVDVTLSLFWYSLINNYIIKQHLSASRVFVLCVFGWVFQLDSFTDCFTIFNIEEPSSLNGAYSYDIYVYSRFRMVNVLITRIEAVSFGHLGRSCVY